MNKDSMFQILSDKLILSKSNSEFDMVLCHRDIIIHPVLVP